LPFHLSFRASVRALFASTALVVFLPAMALAPSAHALAVMPVIRTASLAVSAVTVLRVPGAARPTVESLAAQCDHESTRVAGAPVCAHAAYAYLLEKGLSRDEAAGVVGNLWVESHGVSPKSHQFGNGLGRGVAQWTVGERWQGVLALAQTRGTDPETLHVQLDFLWHELTSTYDSALDAVQAAPTLPEATVAFQNKFEVPVGTAIGASPYTFNLHPHAHTLERLQQAEAAARSTPL
jgi:hypothetical protein